MASPAFFRRCLPLIVFAAAATCSLADRNFINRACSTTFDPNFCVSMLLSDRRSINAPNVPDLAIIALEIAISDTHATAALVQDIARKNPGTDLEAALNQCEGIYNNAAEDLADARDDVGSLSFSEANDSINTAFAAPDSCQKAFVDVTIPAPVANKGEWLGQRIDVCSDLVMSLIDPK